MAIIYDGLEEKWFNYSIEGDEIIEQFNGYTSTYNIDRANKRFDAGKDSGYWFYKVSDKKNNQSHHSTSYSSTTTFRHESDVHNYLRSHTFINRSGDIRITEGYNMALLFNGSELTTAIKVYSFDSRQAIFTAHCPLNGATFRFIVDNSTGTLYCDNDNTYYYTR